VGNQSRGSFLTESIDSLATGRHTRVSQAFISQTPRWARALLLIPLLSGCAINLSQHSADISLPEHWRHTLSGGLSANAVGSWWKSFNDQELDELVARVADSNLQVREMASRIEAAQALDAVAEREFWPSVRLATTPAETPDARGAYLQSGIEATWPLGLFGRAAATKAVADAETALVETDADSLQARIVADTVRSYLDRRAALAAASNLDARIAAQAERAELMRARVRLRLSGAQGLAPEESLLSELKSQRMALDRALSAESERLGLLTATADAYPLSAVAAELPPITPPRLQRVPADLLRSRADVRHAEQAALKAAAQLRVAKADLYPQLTLMGSVTLSVPITGGASGPARALAAVAPAIDIPLFDWGRRRAIATAQDRSLEAALIAYRESILTAVHEVEAALASLDSLDHEAELRRSALQRAAGIEASSLTALRLGRTSRYDALATTLARLEASAALESAEQSRALAFVSLCEALGGKSPAVPT
jgi:outer membrane protein TolC